MLLLSGAAAAPPRDTTRIARQSNHTVGLMRSRLTRQRSSIGPWFGKFVDGRRFWRKSRYNV
jgi:hypothetical protein